MHNHSHPFVTAFIEPGEEFLGYRLRPCTPDTITALKTIDSPFLAREGRTYTAADVQLVAKILAAPNPLRAKLSASKVDRTLYGILSKRPETVQALAQAIVTYLDHCVTEKLP